MWPALPFDKWRDTCETLHRVAQIVGKIALARSPLVNHHWNVAFHLTARGLTTQPLDAGDGRTFAIAFDFVNDLLVLQCSDGGLELVPLVPRTVADTYAQIMRALDRLDIRVFIRTLPVEIENPIAFERDTVHRAYEGEWARAFWDALTAMWPVFEGFRTGFVGKSSPVHFFWGSFDLALTRFSGRRAVSVPEGAIEREAYSHEVISHGFWPGGGGADDAAFYAYAKPEPDGLREAIVRPAGVRYEPSLGIFVLPYEHVRAAASPERELMAFLESTYDAAARLGQWDRESLER